jgi:type III restriction enzyme
MADALIENPILNSPFHEPDRHFKFTDEGITNEIEVIRYVKNHNLGFTIPYTINGEEHQYHPDFITVLDDGHGVLDPLNLIVEVTGEKKKEKAAKVMTARTLWIPAVNNHGAFGRWGFIEIADPWDAESSIRSTIRTLATTEKE